MKALVTGGAGFIGSHLAEALCRKGARVIILDDLSEGNLDNLGWRKSADQVEFVQGSVAASSLVKRLLPGCDWVFHQAALVSVPRSVAEPILSNKLNLEATLELLQAARDARVSRFFFASSSAIYGDNLTGPKREDFPPLPLSPYALQKYAGEKYAQLFHRLYGLTTVCFRYFNIFGPRQSFTSAYSGVIARFCTVMLKGEAPVVFGDGLQTRDFTYVQNVVNANLAAAEAPLEKVGGRVFNVAGGASISLLDLLWALNRLTGQSLSPRFEAARPGDVRHSAASIDAIREALGYEVKVGWEEGLRHTLEFYRGHGMS